MYAIAANVAAEESGLSTNMRTTFQDRHELEQYIREQFPNAVANGDRIAAMRGGRQAAIATLDRIAPERYGKTRNYLDGAVTHLSPYIRHGILSMTEVLTSTLNQVEESYQASTLIKEFGFRAYFQDVYRVIGREIWTDVEAYKTGYQPESYADSLPEDVAEGDTGLACIDAFSKQLRETGYLHNHARLWLAAYLIHWRRVRWQAGARWFLTHLLDGDPASNNLSWQWVASTFSHKPYFFNRSNLERFAGDQYCQQCPLQGHCELDAEYEVLAERLFPLHSSENVPHASEEISTTRQRLAKVEPKSLETWVCEKGEFQSVGTRGLPTHQDRPKRPLIWVHGDCLHPESPAFQAFPDAPAIWVWDEALLAQRQISLKRILFLYESLLELPVTIERGAVAERVVALANDIGCDSIVTVASIAPRFRTIVETASHSLPVIGLPTDPFVQIDEMVDLRRFSRFWRAVGPHVGSLPTTSS